MLIMLASLVIAFASVWMLSNWLGGSNGETAEATGYSNPFSEAVDVFFDDGNAKLFTATTVATQDGIDYIVQESTTMSDSQSYGFKQVFFLDVVDGKNEYYPDFFEFTITFDDDLSEPISITFYDQYIDGSIESVLINDEFVDASKLPQWQERYTAELDAALFVVEQ